MCHCHVNLSHAHNRVSLTRTRTLLLRSADFSFKSICVKTCRKDLWVREWHDFEGGVRANTPRASCGRNYILAAHFSTIIYKYICTYVYIYIYVYSGTCWQRKLYMERFLSMYSSCVISQYNIIRIRSRRTFSHQIPFSFFILFLLITPNNSKCALPIEMIIEVPLLSHQCVRVRSLFIISKLGNKSQEKLS